MTNTPIKTRRFFTRIRVKFGLNKPIKSNREHDHDANEDYDLPGIDSDVTHKKPPPGTPLESKKSVPSDA